MSTSCHFNQLMDEREREIYTLKMANSFVFLSSLRRLPSLSCLSREWLMMAARPRRRSPAWLLRRAASAHLSNIKRHQSNGWVQVSVRYSEQPLITLRHGHQRGAPGGRGGGLSTVSVNMLVCVCVCVLWCSSSDSLNCHFWSNMVEGFLFDREHEGS